MGHGKSCDLVDCLLSPLRLLKDRPVSLAPHSREHPLVALDRAEVSVWGEGVWFEIKVVYSDMAQYIVNSLFFLKKKVLIFISYTLVF